MNIIDVSHKDHEFNIDIELTEADIEKLGLENLNDLGAAALKLDDLMRKGDAYLQATSVTVAGFSLPPMTSAMNLETLEKVSFTVVEGRNIKSVQG